jgi:hypothetical protein
MRLVYTEWRFSHGNKIFVDRVGRFEMTSLKLLNAGGSPILLALRAKSAHCFGKYQIRHPTIKKFHDEETKEVLKLRTKNITYHAIKL